MIINTYIETLKQFEDLSEIELIAVEKMKPYFKTWRIPKNEFLFKNGDLMDISFMVEKGLIRLYKEDDECREKILQFLKEQDFFDDCKSYFERTPISYQLQAIEDTEITYFSMADMEKMASEYPVLNSIGRNINYESMLEHRNHLDVLMKNSPEERYRNIQIHKPYLIQRVSITHLAQYLDMSRECLSRIRAKMWVHQ